MKLLYKAQMIDESTDRVLAEVSSYSQEGLEEEIGKSKFAGAVIKNIEKLEETTDDDEIILPREETLNEYDLSRKEIKQQEYEFPYK